MSNSSIRRRLQGVEAALRDKARQQDDALFTEALKGLPDADLLVLSSVAHAFSRGENPDLTEPAIAAAIGRYQELLEKEPQGNS
jgi:hypothetical protein